MLETLAVLGLSAAAGTAGYLAYDRLATPQQSALGGLKAALALFVWTLVALPVAALGLAVWTVLAVLALPLVVAALGAALVGGRRRSTPPEDVIHV